MDLKGEFDVEEIDIGTKKKDHSYARLTVTGKDQSHLDEILKTIYREGAVSKIQKEIQLKKSPKNYVMPDNFYSTTNNHTQVFLCSNINLFNIKLSFQIHNFIKNFS